MHIAMSKCPIIRKACPKSSNEDGGCPAWVEGVLEKEIVSGEQRVVSDCVLRLLPRWLLQSNEQSHGVRAEMSAMRDSMTDAATVIMGNALKSGVDIPIGFLKSGE